MPEPIGVGGSTRAPSEDGAWDTAETPTAGAATEPDASGSDSLSSGVQHLLEQYLPLSRSRAAYLVDKAGSELACAALPCGGALRLAAAVKMESGGVAEHMMKHFLSGASEPVHVNLQAGIERDPQLKEYIAGHIERDMADRVSAGEPLEGMYGSVWVPQGAYGGSNAGQDLRLALGGTYVEWQVSGSSAAGGIDVRINVSDHYFWSPSEPRPTKCLHECGAELVAKGKATEFYQYGEAHLVVTSPGLDAPMTPPEETRDEH